jgi:hypothetical protein
LIQIKLWRDHQSSKDFVGKKQRSLALLLNSGRDFAIIGSRFEDRTRPAAPPMARTMVFRQVSPALAAANAACPPDA